MNSVVLLTVDSLRADNVSRECLQESLAVLDDDYVMFNNAYSYGVATPFAFPGIIAGSHPVGNGNLPDDATTLAEGIPGDSTGYANNGYLREERGYARGFTQYEENPTIDGKGKISFVDKVARRLQKIDVVRESDLAKTIYNQYLREPLPISSVPADGMTELVKQELATESQEFVWGHWMDPHLPYHPDTAIDSPSDIPDRKSSKTSKTVFPKPMQARSVMKNSNYHVSCTTQTFDTMTNTLPNCSGGCVPSRGTTTHSSPSSPTTASTLEHGQLFHTWNIDPYDEAVHTPLWIKVPGSRRCREVV